MPVNDTSIAQINTVIKELKDKFTPSKTLMTAIAGHMHASVMNAFETQGGDNVVYSVGGAHTNVWRNKMFPGKPLQGSGNLIRSIQARATENESIVSTNRVGAALMHFGGEVKAKKKLGSVKRKKDVWAMEQYFWHQWYASNKKQKFFKILALHMQTHNSISVPARPFMVLTESYKNNIIEEIRNQVTK